MVVLWGLMEDGPLADVFRSLQRLGAQTAFIDQREVIEYTFELEIGSTVPGKITGPSCRFEINSAHSIYVRPYNFEHLDMFSGVERGSHPWMYAAQFEEAMLLWCELANAKVINRPSAMGSNSSKPYQLEIIRESGFAVPETLITTDPDSVVTFLKKHNQIIYKSISSCRSIVSRFREKDMVRLNDVTCCPTQFQEFISGTDYRVHVLGERVFAHRITCPDDDYRYSKDARIQAVALPEDMQERCVNVSRKLGLLFSGVDLRLSDGGEWYCFEVNPSPGFTYFENGTDSLSLELARFFISTEHPCTSTSVLSVK